MNHTAEARADVRGAAWLLLVGLVLVVAVIIGTLGYPSVSSPPAAIGGGPDDHPAAPSDVSDDDRGALGAADGLVPDGASVFDDELPAVANLDPSLRKALRRAATDAAKDGVEFQVNSGWRSPEYQEQLLRQAISEYGSKAEAARWVGTPTTSAHVSGDAIDIGPFAATTWLTEHGAHYGLCQIYRNEPWHYELRPRAVGRRCPRMYADPAHDPRMQP